MYSTYNNQSDCSNWQQLPSSTQTSYKQTTKRWSGVPLWLSCQQSRRLEDASSRSTTAHQRTMYKCHRHFKPTWSNNSIESESVWGTSTCVAALGTDVSLLAEVLPGQQLWKRMICLVHSNLTVPQGVWPVLLWGLQMWDVSGGLGSWGFWVGKQRDESGSHMQNAEWVEWDF